MNLIFVHGFLGNSLNWAPIVQRLRGLQKTGGLLQSNYQWNFISVDLLGHGRKSDVSGYQKLTLDDVAQDLAKEIPAGDWVGLGHSFGIRPILRLLTLKSALKCPKALIVEDSSPTISDHGYKDLRKIFNEVPRSFDSRQKAKEGLEAAFGGDSKMARFLMTNIAENKDGKYGWRFDPDKLASLLEDARHNPLWNEWEAYEGPISMILGSGENSFVNDERAKECVARRGGKPLTVTRIQGAGHWVHAEQAEQFTNELVKIINQIK